jgi:hypothetical protein
VFVKSEGVGILCDNVSVNYGKHLSVFQILTKLIDRIIVVNCPACIQDTAAKIAADKMTVHVDVLVSFGISHFSPVLYFYSPIETLEKETTTVPQLFHVMMSTFGRNGERRDKVKCVGETTEVHHIKLDSTKIREIEKDMLSVYTDAIANLMK